MRNAGCREPGSITTLNELLPSFSWTVSSSDMPEEAREFKDHRMYDQKRISSSSPDDL